MLEKTVKKKQISLNSNFDCSSSSKKAKKTSSSSAPRLMKYKTVEENWKEKYLAPFDVRIWLQYDKDEE